MEIDRNTPLGLARWWEADQTGPILVIAQWINEARDEDLLEVTELLQPEDARSFWAAACVMAALYSMHFPSKTAIYRLFFIAVFGEVARLPRPDRKLLAPYIAEFGAADDFALVHPRLLDPTAVDALTPVQLRKLLICLMAEEAEACLDGDLPPLEAQETVAEGVGFRLIAGVYRTLENPFGPKDPLRLEANWDTTWVNDVDPAIEWSTPPGDITTVAKMIRVRYVRYRVVASLADHLGTPGLRCRLEKDRYTIVDANGDALIEDQDHAFVADFQDEIANSMKDFGIGLETPR